MKIPEDLPTEEEIEAILPAPPSEQDVERMQEEIQRIREEWDPHDLPESQQQLANDISAAGGPDWMIKRVAVGAYHDYLSPYSMPKHKLVEHAEAAGLDEVAHRAKQGHYDP